MGHAHLFSWPAIYSGIIYANEHGVKIVNISQAAPSYVALAETLVNYAYSNGILLVCGAGNDPTQVRYPAKFSAYGQFPGHENGYSNVVSVSATDPWDHIASYSSRGAEVSVAAPGGYGWYVDSNGTRYNGPNNLHYNILSTTPNYYFYLQTSTDIDQTYGFVCGTSLAAPMVTGIAALMLSVNPSLTASQIRNILQSTADKVGGYTYTNGHSNELGYGRVNTYNAVKAAIAAILSSPANGASISIPPVLSWSTSAEATSYRLQVATDSTFISSVRDDSGLTVNSDTVTCLVCSMKYYWRVGGVYNGTTYWSDTRYFNTQIQQLASPVNAATVSVPTTLSWNALTEATSYRLQVDTNSNFTNCVVNYAGLTTTSDTVTCLEYSTTYYWRVLPHSCGDTTHWSDTRHFNTPTALLVSPGSCATVSNPPTLVWNACAGASSYRLQVDTNSNFLYSVKDTTALSRT